MKIMGNYGVNAANSSTDRSREHLTCLRSQLFVAYRNGRVDEAVSLGFLLCWIGGDLTNFKSCYLSNQLPIQILTAIFDMNTDIIILSQFMYYRLNNHKNKISEDLLRNFISAVCIDHDWELHIRCGFKGTSC
ncbi:PREDICTED: putative uncharacterized protein PQLC2L [Colobus angolensis palliatus]|uniref:putative uncharacterized protein PQLC2L n=1 Tax=Colobus angolensis palliatus TaxID=336983 RepID=UPI0005F3E8E5|nr:PREDICTED: putative uncharacterized protein PQLC2L [Colobus angolensis palliatus]